MKTSFCLTNLSYFLKQYERALWPIALVGMEYLISLKTSENNQPSDAELLQGNFVLAQQYETASLFSAQKV